MSDTSTSIAAGVLVAVLGAIPLSWLVTTEGAGEEPAPSTTLPVAIESTLPAETIVTTPPPEIEGLPESITRVLMVNGYAAEEAANELPDSVTRTLVDRGIALTIAEEGDE